ncbi:hypothetical protein [Blattabacterium cuenoti]|uniref:hypothetical protein n=1 Tax=Blattabacterium cuenoti TaxID=1653831 RepID=UPI00163C5A78
MKRLLRASFFLNKLTLEKKIKCSDTIYQIIFIYIGIHLPKFKEINQSIKKIFSIMK